MDNITAGAVAALSSYFIGSVPFGLLTARVVAGIDIRQHGSGNIGATNVGRVVGKKWGLAVLFFDALKGFLAVLLVPSLVHDGVCNHLNVICAIFAILGHMFPVWLKFRGGKGVATALGVIIVLAQSPWVVVASIVVFAVTLLVSKTVSISSMLAAIAFTIGQFVGLGATAFSKDTWSLAAFSLAVPMLIIIRHRGNLKRIIQGTEPRLYGDSSDATDSETTKSQP